MAKESRCKHGEVICQTTATNRMRIDKGTQCVTFKCCIRTETLIRSKIKIKLTEELFCERVSKPRLVSCHKDNEHDCE